MNNTSVILNNSIMPYPHNMETSAEKLRALCLYRVSTGQQVYYNEKHEADIPMQRKACREFCDRMGWEIVYELQEEGVSGHKVRAENRDKIQKVKELASAKKFDVLLVFMFDRIGRIADETPFVVEWLIDHGIRVWSTQEGEQRIESHTDKLTNYIRFWQADGESRKTSIRVSTRMGQIAADGFFRGGPCAYGYKLVKKGRKNKKGVELNDLVINEEEAPIVRIMYASYLNEGYGPQRIANYLRQKGIKDREGKNWHPATIRAILRNPLYTGIIRSGESRSPVQPELIIIDQDTFDAVQELTKARSEHSSNTLIDHGIRVWSTQEGEQRIESHTDKLTNYIRFWQADGESRKTSIRVSTRMGQIAADGFFRGGPCAYGYKLVKKGRKNKKGVELNDLVINEEEAPIVRIMYASYLNEGYGPQRIANYLRQKGIKDREGKNWHPATIRAILRNPLYTGIIRSGESRSPVQPELIIIDQDTFDAVQELTKARSEHSSNTRHIPINTKGKALLTGLAFCGCCGKRLSLTTNGKGRRRADGTDYIRIRYICQTKTRSHGECDGQTGYTMHILDTAVNDFVHTLFQRIGHFSQSDAIRIGVEQKLDDQAAVVRQMEKEVAKAERDLSNLREEIMKALDGQSAFSKEMLGDLIAKQQQKCSEKSEALRKAQAELDERDTVYQQMTKEYDRLISWACVYDAASLETKKMIVGQLFERIEVYRDYKIKVLLNISVDQFLRGLEAAS